MKLKFLKGLVLMVSLIASLNGVLADEVGNLPADAALQKLLTGNERYVKMVLKHPNTNKERRDMLTKFQHPFAVVITCSDSRVPPELLFDQGLGDIFVIRNAGNVLDDHVMGSVEYAVEHLGVNLVIVMGHESCGAVGAAMSSEKFSPGIESIKKSIEPAICQCKKDETYTYEGVIKENAKQGVYEIANNKCLAETMKKRGVKVIPVYYNLSTGKVEVLK